MRQARALTDLFGEQATFFSKHSAHMKISEDNREYLRADTLPWHYPIFLFFKYMYLLAELFRKYYHLCALSLPLQHL